MRDLRDEKIESANRSLRMTSSPGQTGERKMAPADDEPATLRDSRDDEEGRYELFWDDESGGCGTDEGY